MSVTGTILLGVSRLARLQVELSKRARHLRQPTYSTDLVQAVLKLRETYPRWGKDKLVRLGDIAEVHRGFTTGANDFFYLEPTGKPASKSLVHVKNGAG